MRKKIYCPTTLALKFSFVNGVCMFQVIVKSQGVKEPCFPPMLMKISCFFQHFDENLIMFMEFDKGLKRANLCTEIWQSVSPTVEKIS